MQQASMFVEHSVFKCRQTDVFENFNWILRISVKEGNHKLGLQSTKPPGVRNHILKLHFHLWRLLPSPPGQHSSEYNGLDPLMVRSQCLLAWFVTLGGLDICTQ